MADQYLRYWSLRVADDSGKGLELADLAIRFSVHHGTYSFPHTADIRIYNLSRETQYKIGKEFTKLQLFAGYLGNYGLIFQGSIKQVRIGRESATDGYTDIFAADGDTLHNFGYVRTTLPSGYSQEQVWAAIGTAAAEHTPIEPLSTAPNQAKGPRGKVMYGMVRDSIRDFADTNQQLVTVDNGILKAMPLLAFKPGEAVEINATTGMIGSPEQTEQGITLSCLLNPAIMWGTRLKINNSDITQNLVSNSDAELRQQNVIGEKAIPAIFPSLANDGFYKALAVDHIGDTRGSPWYTQIICIALDPTAFTRTPGVVALNLGDPAVPGTLPP